MAVEPFKETLPGHDVPHGDAAGLVSTVTADARSAGTHMPMVCSARATLKRPSFAGCWRNTTVSDVARAVTMTPTTITDTRSSGRVMPASVDRPRSGERPPA
jgi:hypothetical protein